MRPRHTHFIATLLTALLLTGCRQERWETVNLPLPPGMSYAEARNRLLPLDDLTPPKISCAANTLTIRYNALNLSPGNLRYALATPASK